VFMHTKKPNMVNYTIGTYNKCTNQGVKTGFSKKYCGSCVATYFHGHGTQTWCLKWIVTCYKSTFVLRCRSTIVSFKIFSFPRICTVDIWWSL
jgi:hypothetical protein